MERTALHRLSHDICQLSRISLVHGKHFEAWINVHPDPATNRWIFGHCNPNGSANKLGSKQGQSLVQEAKQALQRARSLRDNNGSSGGNNDKVKTTGKKKKNIKEAIEEYKHVINALTDFA
jgi:hypothetical protein